MSSTKYEPVKAEDELPPGSAASNESSANMTPDSDLDDEEDDLEGLEYEEGVELRDFDKLGANGAGRSDPGEGAAGDSDSDEDHTPSSGRKRKRRSSTASFELYTPDEERRVRRKLDTRLVLFVALLYLLSFLDRSNIGNAKVAGLMTDLNMSDNQFEWLLTAFYITYILFEWMTLCFKIFPPHIYIACCVCAWGVLASLQALATTWKYMLVVRIFLGMGEAAFVGIPFYLSFFFRREELAFRVGLFIAAAPLATTFASSLAWGIVSLGNKTGIASWRLLFLVEGFPACVVAVWAWYWIPDSPGQARWLDAREKKIATLRMRKENAANTSTEKSGGGGTVHSTVPRHKRKFQWTEVVHALRDPKNYLSAGMFFCCNVAFSSMPVFLPSIVNGMGYSTMASQGLSAPPFFFAFLVVLVTSFVSDRLQSRSIPMMFHGLLAMSGYLLATIAGALQTGPTLRYLATFPICAGFFSAVTIVITWTLNNQISDEGKGTGVAILQYIGQLGPLIGTRLYPDTHAPFYVAGNGVCAVAMAMVFVLALALRIVLIRENARRRARWKEGVGESLVGGGGIAKGGQFLYLT
ncbi:major facilitator superfamily domain-containing protein [Neohortaea acidophila]|uniref:Major facilitator superfamily domain-containing protein n=1 Tax=Neohortaea acidophila TaxID=245834 RepID=A0A6A6Q6M9_9PEZI|nr:major facilitator superfamily domain-containing protein [Neohortaea acidophila]KAF2488098.1 major facilitator superfamily domain-containing protein [Neohortaea acidophila]